MNADLVGEIVTIILAVIFFGLLTGKLVVGSVSMEIYDERTKKEKNLIRYMGNVLLIIMSLVVCVSVWMHFDVMICFAILVPMMTRSFEDALCATTYIGKFMKNLLLLLFLIGFVLMLAAFRYDGILENNLVMAMIFIAVCAVPFKAFVDMFNVDDSLDMGIREDSSMSKASARVEETETKEEPSSSHEIALAEESDSEKKLGSENKQK